MSTNATASTGPFDLAKSPIHIGAGAAAPQLNFGFDGPSFEAYIATHCSADEPGRLIMVETTPTDWSSWECHTQGDEIVIVLEGQAIFIQLIDGEEQRMAVEPGSTIINPAGVWHSADVRQPLKAIYITPCPGTEHRKR